MNFLIKPNTSRSIPGFLLFILIFIISACNTDDPFEANSGTFTDARDGHEYKWVKIGEQIWMAENLAYVPYVCPPDEQCGVWIYDYYGEGTYGINYQTYGCLYDWESAQEVCPEGWHLPSDEEWMELERFLGMPEDQLEIYNGPRGKDVKISEKLGVGMNLWTEQNTNAADEFGFLAIPSGARYYESMGGYRGLGEYASFWTSSHDEFNQKNWMRTVEPNGIRRLTRDKHMGYSVRYIKD